MEIDRSPRVRISKLYFSLTISLFTNRGRHRFPFQERQAQQQQQARKELHNKSQRKGGEEEMDAPTKVNIPQIKKDRIS